MRRRLLGAEHSSAMSSMRSPAYIYRSQGRWQESKELHLKIVDLERTGLGMRTSSVLTSKFRSGIRLEVSRSRRHGAGTDGRSCIIHEAETALELDAHDPEQEGFRRPPGDMAVRAVMCHCTSYASFECRPRLPFWSNDSPSVRHADVHLGVSGAA